LNRLSIALGIYLLLGVLAWVTLGDSRIRLVTFAILVLFAAKTLLHRKDVMHEDEGKLKWADVAQLVEHSLGKGEVTSSILVIGSRSFGSLLIAVTVVAWFCW
jgi:hypothetical protein